MQTVEQMQPCNWGGEIQFSKWRLIGSWKQILEKMKPCHFGGKIRSSWWRMLRDLDIFRDPSEIDVEGKIRH